MHEIQLLGHAPVQVLEVVLRKVLSGQVVHWLGLVAEQVKQLFEELHVMQVVPESKALPKHERHTDGELYEHVRHG